MILIHVWSWSDCLWHAKWVLTSVAAHMRHIVAAAILACGGHIPLVPVPVTPASGVIVPGGAPGLPSQWRPDLGRSTSGGGMPGAGVIPGIIVPEGPVGGGEFVPASIGPELALAPLAPIEIQDVIPLRLESVPVPPSGAPGTAAGVSDPGGVMLLIGAMGMLAIMRKRQ